MLEPLHSVVEMRFKRGFKSGPVQRGRRMGHANKEGSYKAGPGKAGVASARHPKITKRAATKRSPETGESFLVRCAEEHQTLSPGSRCWMRGTTGRRERELTRVHVASSLEYLPTYSTIPILTSFSLLSSLQKSSEMSPPYFSRPSLGVFA